MSQKLTVLLVEDEPADAHLVRLAFEEGHVLADLHHVLDGVEAFAFLRREGDYAHAPTPELILLDLNMPRMDGRQFLRKIKDDPTLHTLPVVVLTTSDAERDMLDSYDHFAAGYIVKPVDVDDFIKVVRGIGDYWINLVRLPGRS
ncbi:response regulator [Aquaspirillum sp. LM1]|jgi:CheY-like chemotaxis protein|uniref:response regulator n=1 Tax=Aquaspirillum sp. LM1 TaxID=1938604 RepID=UPI0012372810|nr:response regulator [Aquaspirillum sp. LM1]